VKECVTHHHACDCREAKAKEIRDAAIEMLREVVSLGAELRQGEEKLRVAIGISIEELRGDA
jgi:hypothetical protein